MINEKYLDCFNCICLDCYEQFNTEECKYSDCEWCKKEQGQWAERRNKYLKKGWDIWRKTKGGRLNE